MKKIAAVLAIAMMASSCAFGQALTAEEKRTLELKPGVVLLILFVKGSFTFAAVPDLPIPFGHTSAGTGFIYRPDGYIITSGHVVEDANQKDPRAVDALNKAILDDIIKTIKSGQARKVIEAAIHQSLTEDQLKKVLSGGIGKIGHNPPVLKAILANGQSYDADILEYSPPIAEGQGKDVAVLKIPANDLPTVALGDSEGVRIQDQVMVIGYPGTASATLGDNPYISTASDLVPSATNGHISAVKTLSTGSPVLQADVAITHGNSGGPAFNQNGQVIGIATFGSTEAAGFNFLVPINTAMEFVRQAGVTPAPGHFNTIWANALNLYDAGKCKAATAEFDNALQLMPNLSDARQYRNLAAKCFDSKSGIAQFMETSGWALYAVGGIVVLAVLAMLVLRRSPAAVPVAVPMPAMAGAAGGTVRMELPPPPAPRELPAPTRAESFGSIQATSGSVAGKTYPITKEGLLIGRSPKCQVVLQDDTISGEHAWIVPSDGEVVVIDRGSANGTYVNSVDSPKVSKIRLRNGDRIFLGKKGAAFTYFS